MQITGVFLNNSEYYSHLDVLGHRLHFSLLNHQPLFETLPPNDCRGRQLTRVGVVFLRLM